MPRPKLSFSSLTIEISFASLEPSQGFYHAQILNFSEQATGLFTLQEKKRKKKKRL